MFMTIPRAIDEIIQVNFLDEMTNVHIREEIIHIFDGLIDYMEYG
jgi:hypothetical protein